MPADARQVVTTYFDALARRDVDAATACWAPDGVDHLVGQTTANGPEGVRAFFTKLFAAIPDFEFSVETVVVDGEHAAVRWHATGTFSGASPFQGIEPTGQRLTLTGLDLLRVRDGLIVHNDAFSDGLGVTRQLGMLPRAMNGYLIGDDGGGVTVFDTGVKSMASAIASAADAEGDAGLHYAHLDRLAPYARVVHPHPLRNTMNIETGIHGAPRLAHVAFNADSERARASVRKVAALGPSAAWPGHAEPLTGDVATQLGRIA